MNNYGRTITGGMSHYWLEPGRFALVAHDDETGKHYLLGDVQAEFVDRGILPAYPILHTFDILPTLQQVRIALLGGRGDLLKEDWERRLENQLRTITARTVGALDLLAYRVDPLNYPDDPAPLWGPGCDCDLNIGSAECPLHHRLECSNCHYDVVHHRPGAEDRRRSCDRFSPSPFDPTYTNPTCSCICCRAFGVRP